MDNRVGMINYIDYSYAKTKGETDKGDVFASSINMGKSDPLYTTDTVNNESGEIVADANNTETTLNFRLAWTPVTPGSLFLKVNGTSYTTNADGDIKDGSDNTVGHLDTTTGEIAFTFGSAPKANVPYTASYRFNNEDVRSDGYDWDGTGAIPGQAGFTNVPEIQLKINTIPIEAKARTLRSFWAFDAAYELQKEYGQDIEQLLATQSTGKQYCPCM